MPMNIDLETAIRTLVCVSMGQNPEKRVSVGLIVAVLARKFSAYPEVHIADRVTQTILEEGGTVDLLLAPAVPGPFKEVA